MGYRFHDSIEDDEVITTDQYCMEYLFLRYFFENTDLFDEFPMIANEFLKHEFGNLDFYHDVDYGADTPKEAPKTLFINMKILSLIYQGAKKGSEYSINLLVYLYKTYYKQEYNAMKRFKILNSEDALELTRGNSDGGTYCNEWRLPRIFAMAPFLGISMGDIDYAYSIMEDMWEELDHNKRSKLDFEIPATVLDECREQVSDWINEKNADFNEKAMPYWWNARKLACASLQVNGYTQNYITEGKESIDHAEEELNMVKTLALLKLNFKRTKFSFEEVQVLSVIYMFADKVTHELGYIQVALNDILGLSAEYVLEKPARIRFQPEKITGKAGIKPAEEIEQANPAQSEIPASRKIGNREQNAVEDTPQREKRMLSEIERLRTSLHNAEQENIQLREKNNELRTLSDDVRILKQQHEDDRKELHALREHVYRSTESDVDTGATDIADMEAAIAEKRIVIIGGHDNWMNKLKAKFSNWRFISTEISAVVDLRIFDDADYTYFFTEHLAHRTYGAYVKALRERDLPFGYIHSTNIEKDIRQIYEDIMRVV